MQELLIVFLTTAGFVSARYDPTWESLDARPLPNWYDKAKFGIFIHWGVFSVPSYRSEWFWWFWQGEHHQDISQFMAQNYPPNFAYSDFAREFRAEFYNPNDWASIIECSGAKYVVLTTKHHEGFCNWRTNYSFNWNSWEVGPKRDLVGELAIAIRSLKSKVHFGLYHSLFEWFNPLYLKDKAGGFKTQLFSKSKSIPELYELVERYQPDVIWSDGDAGPDDYWTSKDFLAWLYNDSPVKDTVVTNDRWCDGCTCKHGGYFTCDDRYKPGKLISHKWENCFTIDKYSWGYRREAKLEDFYTASQLVQSLIETVAFGGNFLLNVSPNSAGVIPPIYVQRLADIGKWLGANGEAIYETEPWKTIQRDFTSTSVFYTSKPSTNSTYMLITKWPEKASLALDAWPLMTVKGYQLMIGSGKTIPVSAALNPQNKTQMLIQLKTDQFGELPPPAIKFAWVVKLTFSL